MFRDGTREQVGDRLRRWRILLDLSQELVAERAGISAPTLRRIEAGDPGVRFGNVVEVMEVLGLGQRLLDAVEPLNTDLGRLRSASMDRQRASSHRRPR